MRCKLSVIFMAMSVCVATAAQALPFNSDMVGGQMITGSIMRPKAPGSVAFGSLPEHIENRDQAEKLTNPIKGNTMSTLNGERLFAANCAPCHGRWVTDDAAPGKLKHQVGTLPIMPSMDLTLPTYQDRTDGSIFATIHFGKGLMPGYGWKFSPTEHWDLVNYLRHMQGKQ